MKRPALVGAAVGAAAVLVWFKRSTIRAWFTRMRHPLSGFGVSEDLAADPSALVQRMLAGRSPVILVVAQGYDGPRVQALLEQIKASGGVRRQTAPPPPPVFDADHWPSNGIPGT